MAEQNTQTPERKTFKYGDKTYYVDDLLKLHADQKHYFMNFAKDKGRYSGENLNQLQQAIADRINIAQNNAVFNADGSLDTDVAQNVNNITYEPTGLFGLRQKEVYTPQDNTEWAKHYIHKLVGNLKPIEEEQKTGINYDPTKHSFNVLLQSKNITPESLYQYDIRNGDNPRTYNQRGKLLTDLIQQHYDSLKQYNIQFGKDNDIYNDNYLTNLGNTLSTIKEQNYQWTADNMRNTLQTLNLGDNWNNAFLTADFQADKTNQEVEQVNLEAQEKTKAAKEKAEQEALQNQIKAKGDEIYNNALKRYQAAQNVINEVVLKDVYGQHRLDPDKVLLMFNKLSPEIQKNLSNFTHNADKNTKFNRDLSPAPMSYIYPWLWAYAQTNPNHQNIVRKTTIDDVDYYYSPLLSVDDNYAYYLYNPIKHTITRTFKYDIPEFADELKKQVETELKPRSLYNKKGGILKAQLGTYMKYIHKPAEQSQISKESESESDSVMNQPVQWTANDYVQLGTIAANLASMFMGPTSGAVVGAASSITDAINNATRSGEFKWEDFDGGNLLQNLGLDIVGMIPYVGDKLGTWSKIKKSLITFVPRIIGTVSMVASASEADEMIKSLKKVVSDNDSMTPQDYQNIANAVSLVVAGGRGAKNIAKSNRASKKSKLPGQVQVRVKNSDGKIEDLILPKTLTQKITETKGNAKEIEKIIREQLPGADDYTIVVDKKRPRLQSPIYKSNETGLTEYGFRLPFYKPTGKAILSTPYNMETYAKFYKSKSGNKEVYIHNPKIDRLQDRQSDWSNIETLDAYRKSQQEDLDKEYNAEIERIKQEQNEYSGKKSDIENLQNEIVELQKTIETSTVDLQKVDNTLKQLNIENDGIVIPLSEYFKDYKDLDELKVLEDLYSEQIKSNAGSNRASQNTELQKTLDDIQKELEKQNKIATKNQLATRISNTNNEKNQLELSLRENEDKLSELRSKLSSFDDVLLHSKYFKNNDYSRKISFSGKEYTIKPTNLLSDTDLSTLIKYHYQGGKIDINKLNKFLNDGKR